MEPQKPTDPRAATALLAGTLFWGFGFTWAKMGGEAVNRGAGLADGSVAGPVLLLAWRFALASVLWLIIFCDARRAWSWATVSRGVMLGCMLGVGLILQHIGLDRTSEAVAAFLTALTILFVPLLMTVVVRKPPTATVWAGVILATVGVWLMTGATPTGFGTGEALGLIAALIFSIYILTVNHIVPRENAARIALVKFATVAVITLITCFFVDAGPRTVSESLQLLSIPKVWINFLLLVVFTTIGAFGLLTFFQPRVDPTRAALIYLVEPIFASVYAYFATGRGLDVIAICGAALILIANLGVELREAYERRRALLSTPVDLGPLEPV